jgi:G3E family GTPase
VTGLTSYLGAGKTTLFNRSISENHDKRHAVVISGVSGLGVGNDLVIEARKSAR